MANTPGKGTTIKLTISSTPTTIVQATSITAPQMANPLVDTTDLSSTWRTSIGTIPDGGEVTMAINYDASSATHAQLTTSFVAGTVETWLITFPDAQTATVGFTGHITAFNWSEATVENLVSATVTIKVSGAVTITP